MDEQDHAQQALMQMFRHDRAEAEAHPPRKPRWYLNPLTFPWLLAIAVVIFIVSPFAYALIYPRFGPVDTMTSFCRADADAQYADAYALLSQRAQQHESLAAFTQASSAAKLDSCYPTHGIPFIFGGTRASLDVSYSFGASSVTDGTMSFVREHGEWRVDSMSPNFFQLSSSTYVAPA